MQCSNESPKLVNHTESNNGVICLNHKLNRSDNTPIICQQLTNELKLFFYFLLYCMLSSMLLGVKLAVESNNESRWRFIKHEKESI